MFEMTDRPRVELALLAMCGPVVRRFMECSCLRV
jgi:hypothetical protein